MFVIINLRDCDKSIKRITATHTHWHRYICGTSGGIPMRSTRQTNVTIYRSRSILYTYTIYTSRRSCTIETTQRKSTAIYGPYCGNKLRELIFGRYKKKKKTFCPLSMFYKTSRVQNICMYIYVYAERMTECFCNVMYIAQYDHRE